MNYKGIVKGNTIVIKTPVDLVDGTQVEIIPLNQEDPICGSWHDDRSADEIIREIRNARYSRDKSISL
jgi:hypothetical protein